ncbi:MAG: hypothetical protein V7752_07865 [Halopseudomonas sp.]
MSDRVASSAFISFTLCAVLALTSAISSATIAAEQQSCYEGLCARLAVAQSCSQPGEAITLQFEGSLAGAGSFAITTYELLTNAQWTLLDNHQIQLNSYDDVLSNDGFVIGGSFSNSIDIDPDSAQRYTLIHRNRSSSLGFFATAVELSLDGDQRCGQMQIDIKPGSCPNPINIDKKGVTPVAIVGTSALDVRSLKLDSIRLEGVTPARYSFEDATAEIAAKASIYDCSTSTSDGIEDLSLKFRTQDLAAALQIKLGRQPFDGEIIALTLTAETTEGSPLNAEDSIQVLVKGKRK